MKTNCLVVAIVLFVTALLNAQNDTEVTGLLKKLKSQDIETRYSAMRDLQTSLDPRIPDACLPLLQMEGDSIRRLAARAIGSRWHQIPKERTTVFTDALKAQLESEPEGLVNMARRGIALLNRNYEDAMLSRSKSKRWVIYERFGLPCLIDTKIMTEELLGVPGRGRMMCAWGNTKLAPTVKWHPEKDMVAMNIIENRKFSTVWLWRESKELREFTYDEQLKLLGIKEEDAFHAAGFYSEIIDWSGNNLDITLDFSVRKGEEIIDHKAKLRWNSSTDKLRLLSDKTTKE